MSPLIGFVLEQFVQWKFGTAGGLALLLLLVGFKIKNSTCAGVGAIVLALLAMQPGMG
ncbi:hypothetical protein OG705_15670 [Streptomyces sp. NBC_00838]|uniref:hypothetical protein n=1 Tax=Streptomyces sp. NBC_00838 TaxID=2903680 RepID=UPI0038661945|nr:hypothetical protein OG705_15670 [Streptomyces sp. NBC_00838]